MKVLLIGKNGLLGWELERTLGVLGDVVAVGSAQLDLTHPDAIVRTLRDVRPQLIVNAAAYTAVDKAESEPDLAMTVNGQAPGILAEEARRLDALLVQFSTDYVFDGSKSSPYTEDDLPHPINVYGRTKLAGERAVRDAGCRHLILRTGWLYGERGDNFVLKMRRRLAENRETAVVDDQIGTPCWSRWLAEAVTFMLASRNCRDLPTDRAVYHVAPVGFASRYEFALAVRELMPDGGMPRPVSSAAYPLSAVRPANSCLDCARVMEDFGLYRPDWRQLLALCSGG